MMPAGPLMIEHRLIERMVRQLQEELNRIDKRNSVDAVFIDSAVDFFRFYTDRCHHGKEEDFLFAALVDKPLEEEHRLMMDTLVEEHVIARRAVGQLLLDKERFIRGESSAMSDMKGQIELLLDLYPKHIKKEDEQFFLPVMKYFSVEEQEEMLHRFSEFDKKLIHERYRVLLEELEERRGREK